MMLEQRRVETCGWHWHRPRPPQWTQPCIYYVIIVVVVVFNCLCLDIEKCFRCNRVNTNVKSSHRAPTHGTSSSSSYLLLLILLLLPPYRCVLKDNLLYLYNTPTDPAPTRCLALELFVALAITLQQGRRAIVLRRANRQLASATAAGPPDVDFYLLHPTHDAQQDHWTKLLRRRCLSHAKVFGAPLDEVLERQQRKPPVPKLVEELVRPSSSLLLLCLTVFV